MSNYKENDFETFRESPRPPGNIPKVTISRSGNFVFNKKFRDKFWEELEHSYVIFQYDRKNQIIRLMQRLNPETNAYRIRDLDRMLVVSGKAFLQHFKIPFKKSQSYEVVVQKGEDHAWLIYVDLKQIKGQKGDAALKSATGNKKEE